jgi:methylmalonyl-CoA mutase N-terminal domain/subunit
VSTRLEAPREVAMGSENTMPAIIDCVRVRATEGEIIATLKAIFGAHVETPVF